MTIEASASVPAVIPATKPPKIYTRKPRPPVVIPQEIIDEAERCRLSAGYFITRYCWLYDATSSTWLTFDLWPAQRSTLATIRKSRQVVILKARQLGLTWLVLVYALWLLLFRPGSTVLLFSRRDDEAVELCKRLWGMWEHLPAWLQQPAVKRNDHEMELDTGSRALAFPTTGGRSYTATLAIVDEADFLPDLDELMNAVKPTVDAGGQMILLSTADKSRPQSAFKRIYGGAKRGGSGWVPVFLPWMARPGRNEAWYVEKEKDCFARTGALDDVNQEYPASDIEAIAPRTLDKRMSAAWLAKVYDEVEPIDMMGDERAPAIPGLHVYRLPDPERVYVIGIDPAEGNPTSDDSAACVLDCDSGEECACIAGKFDPSTIARYADMVGEWYNRAALMVERNNHGHAVLLWLKEFSSLRVIRGLDGHPGWLDNARGKALLYDNCADMVRDGETSIHSFDLMMQLQAISGADLRAPDGDHDDLADAYALAGLGMSKAQPLPDSIPGHDPFHVNRTPGDKGPKMGMVHDIEFDEDGREIRTTLRFGIKDDKSASHTSAPTFKFR